MEGESGYGGSEFDAGVAEGFDPGFSGGADFAPGAGNLDVMEAQTKMIKQQNKMLKQQNKAGHKFVTKQSKDTGKMLDKQVKDDEKKLKALEKEKKEAKPEKHQPHVPGQIRRHDWSAEKRENEIRITRHQLADSRRLQDQHRRNAQQYGQQQRMMQQNMMQQQMMWNQMNQGGFW